MDLPDDMNWNLEKLVNVHYSKQADSSGSDDESFRPPLLSLAAIEANLAESDSSGDADSDIASQTSLCDTDKIKSNLLKPVHHSGNSVDAASVAKPIKFINSTKLTVGVKLRDHMTKVYCHICNKHASTGEHYKAAVHCNKVTNWIRLQGIGLSEIPEVYCIVCNVALVYTQSTDLHYSSPEHIKYIQSFCAICMKRIGDFKKHLISNGHLKKLDKIIGSSQPFLKLTAYNLNALLTLHFCHVCNIQSYPNDHYKSQKHQTNVLSWIYTTIKSQNPALVNQVYCKACMLVMINVNVSEHYMSPGHQKKAAQYCHTEITTDLNSPVQSKHVVKSSKVSNEETVPLCTLGLDTLQSIQCTGPVELSKLITVNECKLCSLMLPEHNGACEHYKSSSRKNLQTKVNDRVQFCAEGIKPPIKENKMEDILVAELYAILNKAYFSRKISLNASLRILKNLNKELSEMKLKQQ